MEKYRNFKISSYIRAYELTSITDEEIQAGIDYFQQYTHLDKMYIENHRGKVDIPVKRLQEVKALCEKNGLEVAGGITSTQFVNGIRKPSYFDTFCYTDPDHRAEYVRIVRELASVFDEIILDDFFFTACRCEMCIKAKGKLSWKDYRLKLMEDFAHVIVDEAHKVNPKMKFVIKYPNWYESFPETGFKPGKQKDIFDGIYSGTETRLTFSPQHLQRYESFSIIRLLNNTAPGKNGGGWVDLGGSQLNITNCVEQCALTVLARTPELTLWNFNSYNGSDVLPAVGRALQKIDAILDRAGEPCGVSTWEPFNGDGEDQLYNYLGMCGLPIEPVRELDEKAPVVFCTEATGEDPDCVEKLEEYVRNGGNTVVTIGFFRRMYDKGVKDFTSVRLTNRHVMGDCFMIDNANYMNKEVAYSRKPILFEVISYKTNATQADISVMVDEDNFPVMTEDNYGKGRFFILNVPENFADLYKLPLEVIRNINKHLTMYQRVYVGASTKVNLFPYDNNVYVLYGYDEKGGNVQLIVRGESNGIKDLDTGKVYTEKLSRPAPAHRSDATNVIDEPLEYIYNIRIPQGKYFTFSVI